MSAATRPRSGGAWSGLGDDGDADRLTPFRGRHRDRRGVRDGGMREQHVLDFARRNILAAAHDHIVGPAGQEQIAVRVQPAGIARGKPALAHRARCARDTRRTPDRRAHRSRRARRPAAAGPPRRGSRSVPSAADDRPSRGGRGPAGSVDACAARCSSGPKQRDRRAGLGEPVGIGESRSAETARARARSAPRACGRRRRRWPAMRTDRPSTPASMRAMTRASIVGTRKALVARSAAASASQSSGSKAGSSTIRRMRVDRTQQRRDSGNVIGRHADQRGLVAPTPSRTRRCPGCRRADWRGAGRAAFGAAVVPLVKS